MSTACAETTYTDVTFALRSEKQSHLIYLLMQHEPDALFRLSQLLNLSHDVLVAVLEQKAYLNDCDAKKLAEYFCLFFGG